MAVILFKKSGESVHPYALNFFKTALATILLLPTLTIARQSLLHPAPLQDYILLVFSGIIGIAVADTLFFKSLNLLGAGLSAIVDCLYSPFIIILSVIFLNERLGWLQVIGVLLILSAILLVTRTKSQAVISRHDLTWGVVFGALAMALMAVSIVMVKPILNRSPMFWTTEIRLIGGTVALMVWLLFHKQKTNIVKSILCTKSWKYTLLGSIMGGYVAMVIWIGGMKYTQASASAALNQSSNVFVFIFAALFLKEKITPERLLAIMSAIIGVFLVTFW